MKKTRLSQLYAIVIFLVRRTPSVRLHVSSRKPGAELSHVFLHSARDELFCRLLKRRDGTTR